MARIIEIEITVSEGSGNRYDPAGRVLARTTLRAAGETFEAGTLNDVITATTLLLIASVEQVPVSAVEPTDELTAASA